MNGVPMQALLIGNWDYQDADGVLRPLRGPRNDLDRMRAALAHPEYGLFTDDDILVRKNLTSTAITMELLGFVKNAGLGVNLLVYYSGHGERLGRGRLGLCGVDLRYRDREALAFNTSVLKDWLAQYERDAHTVIILDCCYAGGYKGAVTEDDLSLSFGSGTVVLSSGDHDPAPDALRDDEPSPFTGVLADLLVDPALLPRSGGYLAAEDLYQAMLDHRPPLVPTPRQSLHTVGRVPLARRPVPEEPPTPDSTLPRYRELAFETVDLRFDDRGCTADGVAEPYDLALLDVNRKAAVRRLSTLADALMRTKEYANQEWWQRAIGKAWQAVGANLFEAAFPDSVRERIQNPVGDSAGTVLKVRLAFEGDMARLLEPYPWEYLQVGRGPDTVPLEGDAPVADLPLPLAVRPGLLIERASRSGGSPPSTSAASLTTPTVGVVNSLPDPVAELGRRTVRELEALKNINLLFHLTGPDATWTNLTDSLEHLPQHLVLFVPVNRDRGPAALGFTGGRPMDWRPAVRLVAELKERSLELSSLILVTFAAGPGVDTVRGTFELARNLNHQGVSSVVFSCHWPGFERSVAHLPGSEPETFVGLLLNALSRRKQLDKAVYYARSQVMRRVLPEFEVLFGVPGYYHAPSSTATERAATGPSGAATSATISAPRVRS